jgi:hypothetical protein
MPSLRHRVPTAVIKSLGCCKSPEQLGIRYRLAKWVDRFLAQRQIQCPQENMMSNCSSCVVAGRTMSAYGVHHGEGECRVGAGPDREMPIGFPSRRSLSGRKEDEMPVGAVLRRRRTPARDVECLVPGEWSAIPLCERIGRLSPDDLQRIDHRNRAAKRAIGACRSSSRIASNFDRDPTSEGLIAAMPPARRPPFTSAVP